MHFLNPDMHFVFLDVSRKKTMKNRAGGLKYYTAMMYGRWLSVQDHKVAEIRKQAADAIAKINAMTHLNATMREKMIAQINAEVLLFLLKKLNWSTSRPSKQFLWFRAVEK